MRIVSGIGVLAAALALAACGSNGALLADRSRGEAEHLREYCERAGLKTAETQRADAALASANRLFKDGDEEAAHSESALAGTLYRLALAKRDLAEIGAQVDGLKRDLANDKDQLQTYQEILQEMKTVRKP